MTTTFIHGNCLEELKKLDDEIVDCCITSPPYYALRDYGEADQIGLEDTYQEYIENLVNVFEEVKRVLKADGTLWLNLGDSYFNYRPGKGMASGKNDISKHLMDFPQELGRRGLKQKGLKNKDIMGIPFRVAFALQDQGWYLRQDIIWHKTGMPESVKDRCTKAHEYIFLLAKNEKYYFDNEAIKEDGIIKAGTKGAKGSEERQNKKGVNARPPEYKIYDGKRNKRSVWKVNTQPFKESHFATFPPKLIEPMVLAGSREDGLILDCFAGAGTTGLVAERHNRNSIMIELNEDYIEMAKNRIFNDAPLFTEVT